MEYFPNNYKIKTYLSLIGLCEIDINSTNDGDKFETNFKKLIEAYIENNYSDFSIPVLLINLCNIMLLAGKYEEAGRGNQESPHS